MVSPVHPPNAHVILIPALHQPRIAYSLLHLFRLLRKADNLVFLLLAAGFVWSSAAVKGQLNNSASTIQ